MDKIKLVCQFWMKMVLLKKSEVLDLSIPFSVQNRRVFAI